MLMRMTRKRLFRLLLAGVIFVLAAGCANSGIIENMADVRKIGDQAIKTIVIWHTYSDEENRVFEEVVIPAFEAAHPSIRIESVRQEHNDEYQAALIARMSSGKKPDVVRLDYSWVTSFADKNLLYPLNSFPDFGEVSAPLRKEMLRTNEYKGNFYGLPLNITTKAAVFNRAAFEAAGFDEPPRSLMEVAEAAREQGLTIGMTGIRLWESLPYFFGFGGTLANESFTQASGYFNSESSVKAMEKLLALYREGVINPRLLTGGADLWNDVLTENNTFMIDEGPWFYSILMNSRDVGAEVLEATVRIPFPTDGKYGSIIGGENLVLANSSRNKAEAWTFIRWMMRKETQQLMFEAGLIPTNMEAFQDSKSQLEHNTYLEVYMEGVEDGFYFPATPQWSKITAIYEETMESVFIHGKDVRQAMDEAAAEMDAALGKM